MNPNKRIYPTRMTLKSRFATTSCFILGVVFLVGVKPTIAQERESARSSGGELGNRISPEAQTDRRRPEAQRDQRPTERESSASRSLRGFQPQTSREAALFKMIVELQREVETLRSEVQALKQSSTRDGDRIRERDLRDPGTLRDSRDAVRRDGDMPRDRDVKRDSEVRRDAEMPRDRNVRGDGDALRESDTRRDGSGDNESDPRDGFSDTFKLPARWQTSREGKVFRAYDKNADQVVSLDEWLSMTNGNINAERRALQSRRFYDAEPSGDGNFTPAEFIWWYSIGRRNAVEGGRRASDRE